MTDRFVCTKNHSIFIFSRNLLRIRSCDWFLPVILLEYDDSLYRILVKSWLYWYNRKLLSLYFRMPHRRVLNKQSKFACYVSSPQQCALRKIESSNRRMREVELKSTAIEQNKIFSSRRLLYCTGLGNDIFTLQMQPIQNTGDLKRLTASLVIHIIGINYADKNTQMATAITVPFSESSAFRGRIAGLY